MALLDNNNNFKIDNFIASRNTKNKNNYIVCSSADNPVDMHGIYYNNGTIKCCDFSYADFSNTTWTNTTFTNVNLSNVNFDNAAFTNVKFINAIFTHTPFLNAKIEPVFTNVDFFEVDLTNANFEKVVFKKIRSRHVKVSTITKFPGLHRIIQPKNIAKFNKMPDVYKMITPTSEHSDYKKLQNKLNSISFIIGPEVFDLTVNLLHELDISDLDFSKYSFNMNVIYQNVTVTNKTKYPISQPNWKVFDNSFTDMETQSGIFKLAYEHIDENYEQLPTKPTIRNGSGVNFVIVKQKYKIYTPTKNEFGHNVYFNILNSLYKISSNVSSWSANPILFSERDDEYPGIFFSISEFPRYSGNIIYTKMATQYVVFDNFNNTKILYGPIVTFDKSNFNNFDKNKDDIEYIDHGSELAINFAHDNSDPNVKPSHGGTYWNDTSLSISILDINDEIDYHLNEDNDIVLNGGFKILKDDKLNKNLKLNTYKIKENLKTIENADGSIRRLLPIIYKNTNNNYISLNNYYISLYEIIKDELIENGKKIIIDEELNLYKINDNLELDLTSTYEIQRNSNNQIMMQETGIGGDQNKSVLTTLSYKNLADFLSDSTKKYIIDKRLNIYLVDKTYDDTILLNPIFIRDIYIISNDVDTSALSVVDYNKDSTKVLINSNFELFIVPLTYDTSSIYYTFYDDFMPPILINNENKSELIKYNAIITNLYKEAKTYYLVEPRFPIISKLITHNGVAGTDIMLKALVDKNYPQENLIIKIRHVNSSLVPKEWIFTYKNYIIRPQMPLFKNILFSPVSVDESTNKTMYDDLINEIHNSKLANETLLTLKSKTNNSFTLSNNHIWSIEEPGIELIYTYIGNKIIKAEKVDSTNTQLYNIYNSNNTAHKAQTKFNKTHNDYTTYLDSKINSLLTSELRLAKTNKNKLTLIKSKIPGLSTYLKGKELLIIQAIEDSRKYIGSRFENITVHMADTRGKYIHMFNFGTTFPKYSCVIKSNDKVGKLKKYTIISRKNRSSEYILYKTIVSNSGIDEVKKYTPLNDTLNDTHKMTIDALIKSTYRYSRNYDKDYTEASAKTKADAEYTAVINILNESNFTIKDMTVATLDYGIISQSIMRMGSYTYNFFDKKIFPLNAKHTPGTTEYNTYKKMELKAMVNNDSNSDKPIMTDAEWTSVFGDDLIYRWNDDYDIELANLTKLAEYESGGAIYESLVKDILYEKDNYMYLPGDGNQITVKTSAGRYLTIVSGNTVISHREIENPALFNVYDSIIGKATGANVQINTNGDYILNIQNTVKLELNHWYNNDHYAYIDGVLFRYQPANNAVTGLAQDGNFYSDSNDYDKIYNVDSPHDTYFIRKYRNMAKTDLNYETISNGMFNKFEEELSSYLPSHTRYAAQCYKYEQQKISKYLENKYVVGNDLNITSNQTNYDISVRLYGSLRGSSYNSLKIKLDNTLYDGQLKLNEIINTSIGNKWYSTSYRIVNKNFTKWEGKLYTIWVGADTNLYGFMPYNLNVPISMWNKINYTTQNQTDYPNKVWKAICMQDYIEFRINPTESVNMIGGNILENNEFMLLLTLDDEREIKMIPSFTTNNLIINHDFRT